MLSGAATKRSVMPFTTQPERHRGLERVGLLNPNSADVKGPSTQYREPHRVKEGPLASWDVEAVRSLSLDVSAPVAIWDFSWTEKESYWEREVLKCQTPEEVEGLLPSKWFGYRWDVEVDDTLSKVCTLCTSIVDRFIQLSQPSNGAADVSASKWRLRHTMLEKLQAIVDLFESTIGEHVPMFKLRDAGYVRQCWERLGEEDRAETLQTLQQLQSMSLAP